MGLYNDLIPATLCDGGAGSTVGGGVEEDLMASSLSRAS